MKVSALLTGALAEIGVSGAADAVSGEDLDLALLVFNELLDLWNADEARIYNIVFQTYTLTANLQPHTIGIAANTPTFTIPTTTDGGTGTLGNRPLRILGANLVLTTSSPNVNRPLTIRDEDWWRNQRVQALTSAIPTDLYYDPSWPNGSIYLWPKPTAAYGIQLELLITLAQVVLTDTFSLPPGYQQALRLTLAESLCAPFLVPMPQSLPDRAREARQIVFAVNTSVPRLTSDYAGSAQQGNWDYRTGSVL